MNNNPPTTDIPTSASAVGTVLTRTFKGAEHRVTVIDDGFEYNGEIHKSLSRIVRMITGTSWNRWTFWGLK